MSDSKQSLMHQLMQSLQLLPGVGPKAAQRMVYYLLQHDKAAALQISEALVNAVTHIKHCQKCNTFSETPICELCSNETRDATRLCVTETPTDQALIEQTKMYKGYYFVLMGTFSPINGVGPKEIGFEKLLQRATDGVVEEVILALSFNNESEATAHYLGEKLKEQNIKVTRLARGVPVGADLEFVDVGTIARAFLDRRDT